jgi:IS30 family transposase
VAQSRLSVRKIRDVLRLKFETGVGERQIAASLGVARSTVQEALRRAREAGFTWPLPPELTEVVLLARLYPQKSAPAEFGRNRQPARDAQQVDRRNRPGADVRDRQRHGLSGRCAGMS